MELRGRIAASIAALFALLSLHATIQDPSRTSLVAITFLNLTMLQGLVLGAILLMCPVTSRLMPPKYRVYLWEAGWFILIGWWIFPLGAMLPLPLSFRELVTARPSSLWAHVPAFFPDTGVLGEQVLALPGGLEVPFVLTVGIQRALALLFYGGLLLHIILDVRQRTKLKKQFLQGTRLTREERAAYGLTRRDVAVRLCSGLPTSFVWRGKDPEQRDSRYVICLQTELPRERLELVLRHELEHINQHHLTQRNLVTGSLYLGYWNPILWLAARLTFLDMELACDAGVLEGLTEAQRRDYARALVELGAGRTMWGPMATFGECDAARRVRQTVEWREPAQWKLGLSLLLAALLTIFFYCGGFDPAYTQARWMAYVHSPELVQDLSRRLEEPDLELVQLWSRGEEQLTFQDGTGRWYFAYLPWSGLEYYVSGLMELEDPGLAPRYFSQILP